MGHPQPPTPTEVDNETATGFLERTIKQKRSKAIDMGFYWVRDRVNHNQFMIYWIPGANSVGDYVSKHQFCVQMFNNCLCIIFWFVLYSWAWIASVTHIKYCLLVIKPELVWLQCWCSSKFLWMWYDDVVLPLHYTMLSLRFHYASVMLITCLCYVDVTIFLWFCYNSTKAKILHKFLYIFRYPHGFTEEYVTKELPIEAMYRFNKQQ